MEFTKQNIRDYLGDTFGNKHVLSPQQPGRFLGSNPISIERQHFDKLKRGVWHVSIKADGTRHGLLFMRANRRVNLCCLIGRNWDVVLLDVQCAPQLFNGTYIDGELVGDTFWGFDTYMVEGKQLKDMPFSARLASVETALRSVRPFRSCMGVVAQFDVKPFFILRGVQQGDHLLSNSRIANDGLILQDEATPFLCGTSGYKWKRGVTNTVDFRVQRINEEVFGLYVEVYNNNNDDENQAVQCCYWDDFPHIREADIYECVYDIENDFWTPHKHREDKQTANSRHTYERTLVNISEDIQLEEIFAICQDTTTST